MFWNKVKNWAHSSISEDKQEIETYQNFQNEIENIRKIIKEYLDTEGSEDNLLKVNYNNQLVPLNLLQTLKNSILNNKKMSIEEKVKESSLIEEFYRRAFEELENRVIRMAQVNPNNVYLSKISSSLGVINTLLKRYLYLTAIQRSGLTSISSYDELKKLEDNILIRISELDYRITTDTMKR